MTFEEALDGIMDALVDAGFNSTSINAVLNTESAKLFFRGDEAERLLRIIQRGLKALADDATPQCSNCGCAIEPGRPHSYFSMGGCYIDTAVSDT